jgi:hypothetical protein
LTECAQEEWTYCADCNCWFRSRACFDNHKSNNKENGGAGDDDADDADDAIDDNGGGRKRKNKKKKKRGGKRLRLMTTCERYRRCKDCRRMIDYSKVKARDANGVPAHHCGLVYCSRCKLEHPVGDKECFLQPIQPDDAEVKKERRKKKRETDRQELAEEGFDESQLELFDVLQDLADEAEAGDKQQQQQRDNNKDKDSKDKEREAKERGTKIYFDFECTQEKFLTSFERDGMEEPGNVWEHVPNLCVALKICRTCKQDVLERRRLDSCASCGQSEHVFEGENCRDEFCAWLFSEQNRGATAIAHNAKGYDAQFLSQYLIKEALTPTVLSKGLEFMSLKFGGIRVIDSLNFLPMALSALPAAFGQKELKKGYFPHYFNRRENWDYVGPIPEAHYYGADRMPESKRRQFFDWYESQRDVEFDFRKEILDYCRSDVDILAKCCTAFEDLFEQVCGVRPFDVAITIASACMHTFRRNFLKPGTIATVPHGGYSRKDRHSAQSLRWLKWTAQEEGIHIQHAGNGREHRIGDVGRVDGYCRETKTVYEYHGCLYHGCPRCFKDRWKNIPATGLSAEAAYQSTLSRGRKIRDAGYTLVEKWSCEFAADLKTNQDLALFVKQLGEICEPLDPRDALRGGRTNATTLYRRCDGSERIDYIDVCR